MNTKIEIRHFQHLHKYNHCNLLLSQNRLRKFSYTPSSLCRLESLKGVVHTWCPGTVPGHRYETVRCSDFGAQF